MRKIVLASSSPRRKELLENLGLDFKIVKSDLKEIVRKDENPEEIVMALALEKALDVSNKVADNTIVIAADTIVYKDKVLGKPQNYEDAFNMLKTLENDIHYVYTGLAVLEKGTFNKIVTYEKTKVKIRKLSDEKINRYIKTGEAWDKAGSYGIQKYGATLVEWINGDYFNVVGLPISKLDYILSEYFDIRIY